MAALRFYLDSGVDEALMAEPADRFALSMAAPVAPMAEPSATLPLSAPASAPAPALLGKTEAVREAAALAAAAKTLEELAAAIAAFDGVGLKKTAMNMVFADGSAGAKVMVIGEAPGTDEDRQGKPFVGLSGQLLDKMLAAIDLGRQNETPESGAYITNVLNWRPPGNRTPNPAEIEVSLPFIERHIQLAKPALLVLCGEVAAQSLLGRETSVSRLRGVWHEYRPRTGEMAALASGFIPAIVTYHPSYLLRTPAQKKAAWADLLMVKSKLAAD